MLYQKYSASVPLRPYVECYFIWESKTVRETHVKVESPPSGFASIVFNYGDPYLLSNQQHQQLSVPKSFLSGQALGRYELHLTPKIGMVGAVFRPAALASLFRLPMYEFTEERIDLRAIFGPEIDGLAEQLAEASPSQKIRLLDAWLRKQLKRESCEPDAIDFSTNKIIQNNGNIQLDEVLQEVFMSRRQFERKFLMKVGVSPKLYTRLYRIGRMCYHITHQHQTDWQRLIGEGGYYDQAHFIKEFRQFMGASPTEYFKNNQELANYLVRFWTEEQGGE